MRLIYYEDLRGNRWAVTGQAGQVLSIDLVAAGEPADGEPDSPSEALAELGPFERAEMERRLAP